MLGEFLFFLIGLSLGSFGNVLIYRLSEGISLHGRSVCPNCNRVLAAIDLIPLLSFVLLHGKCRRCGAKIGWQYPLVELVSGFLFLFAYAASPLDASQGLLFGIALWLLLLIAIYDYRSHTIPDALSLPLILVAFLLAGMKETFPIQAALVGLGFFAVQWAVSRGKWVGSGDIFLGAGIGALAGTPFLTGAALFVAYVSGALVASFLLITNKVTRKAHIAFGPYLVFGTAVVLLFQERFELLLAMYT